jgi:tetratricopeptide (TPR) repeat protein
MIFTCGQPSKETQKASTILSQGHQELEMYILSRCLRLCAFFCALSPANGFLRTTTSAQESSAPSSIAEEARRALSQGVEAYKNGQHDVAIARFTRAEELDPSSLNAHLYLANTYASEYIPGVPSDENVRFAYAAVDEYKNTLALDSSNLSAIDGIASMLFQISGTPFDPDLLDQSKSYHLQHIQLKPDDPEPYYWIGVIDWTLSFRGNNALRKQLNDTRKRPLAEVDPLPDDLRIEYAQAYGATIDEGIANLQKAIELRPNYDDAMAYLSLLYRRKADAAPTQDERDRLNKMADDLLDHVKDIKQKRASEQN